MSITKRCTATALSAAALWCAATDAHAATRDAPTCDLADVVDTINQSATGDTVNLPACDVTWPTALNFSDAAQIPNGNNLAITIQGQVTGCPSNCTTATTIRDGRTSGGGGLIQWVTVDTGLTRITGINLVGAATGSFGNATLLFLKGSSHQVRIDHNQFTTFYVPGYFSAAWTDDYTWGVFDHNHGLCGGHCLGVFHRRWNGTGASAENGDASFAAPDDFGTERAFFVEDNILDTPEYPYPIDSYLGSRIVVRKNDIINGSAMSDHGTETAGRGRSIRWKEVYDNTIHWNFGGFGGLVVGYRGGTGPTFNNTLDLTNGTTSIDAFAGFQYNRNGPDLFTGATDAAWPPWGRPVPMKITSLTRSGEICTATVDASDAGTIIGHGYAEVPSTQIRQYATISGSTNGFDASGVLLTSVLDSTHFSYTCSSGLPASSTGAMYSLGTWDNNNDPGGLLALDQPGAGQSDLLSDPSCELDANGNVICGYPIDTFNATTRTNGSAHQKRSPIYVWGNYKTVDGLNPQRMVTQNDSVGASQLVQINGVPPSNVYDDSVTFDGTQGVGVGTLASRPTSCAQGVAYWVTDEGSWDTTKPPETSGVLYVCGATGWPSSPSYTPYVDGRVKPQKSKRPAPAS